MEKALKKGIWMTSQGIQAIKNAYNEETQKELSRYISFFPGIWDPSEMENRREDLRQTEVIFTTWGMFSLTEEEIRGYFPKLQAVFYGAGSVQYFARPFLKNGIRIYSAFAANAVPVAEYTTAQIILAGKGFYQASRLYKETGDFKKASAYSHSLSGNYGDTVGIIGAGTIGRMVIERLRSLHLKILVFDPFLPAEKAESMGVELCSLPALFSRSQVISNHLANNEQTKGMLDYSLFSAMRPYAVFINTGRGAQVVEEDLVRALEEEPGRTAVLDVTWPEPVEKGHAFYRLPNVILTPHIAGSQEMEVARMGSYMGEAFHSFLERDSCPYEVTEAMLKTMA